ncbi:unnamed protein product [Closterium sp. NIES-53]
MANKAWYHAFHALLARPGSSNVNLAHARAHVLRITAAKSGLHAIVGASWFSHDVPINSKIPCHRGKELSLSAPLQGILTRVLQLLLPPGYSAFDAFLSELERSDGEGSSSAPEPRWGAPADCPLDESATGANDDVEFWAADGLPEHLPIPSFPPPNKKRPHPSRDNRYARPPSPRHKPTKHRHNSYTSHEKLQWILKLEAGEMSMRRMSRESGISQRCLTEWKNRKGELEGSHGARCRLHGRGRSLWYRDMEADVYRRFLAHRKKCFAVSIARLQKWSHEVMKELHPGEKWAGSQRWTQRFRRRWNLTTRVKTRVGQKLSSNQTPLWLEMPSERTVEEVGSRSVPVRSGSYQKERVTVMLACTASGEKLKPWVFFKRKTVPKGDFPSALLVLDSYRGHLTPEVKKKFGELNLVPAVIPAGCTSEIQPLDVAVNRSFKAAVRQLYQEWFEREGVDTLTKKGNIKKPPVELALKWIAAAWKSVPKELIQWAFLTCGISNALDGSQDKLCLQHRRDELEGEEVDIDDEIAAHGFFCNNVEEPESDSEANPDDHTAADD